MVVGRLLAYWEGNFSGATLNFGRVLFFSCFFSPSKINSSQFVILFSDNFLEHINDEKIQLILADNQLLFPATEVASPKDLSFTVANIDSVDPPGKTRQKNTSNPSSPRCLHSNCGLER